MTNQEMIDRAAMLLGMIEASASLDSTNSNDAMAVLNEMMAAWKVSSKDFNWFSQDTLGDTVPVPDWALDGIISNLAVQCGPMFRAPITDGLAYKASKGDTLIMRTLINLNLEPADMTNMPQGRNIGRSILTDS